MKYKLETQQNNSFLASYHNTIERLANNHKLTRLNALPLATKIDGTKVYIPLGKLLEYLELHLQVIGPTGCGKSKFLEHLFRLLITNVQDASFILIDPKGDLYRAVLSFCIAEGLRERLILFDPGEKDHIIGYNPLKLNERLGIVNQTLGILEAIRSVWGQQTFDRTPQLVRWLANAIYTGIKSQANFIDLPDILSFDKNWKQELFVSKINSKEETENFDDEVERIIREEWNRFDRQSLPRKKDDMNSSYARIRAFCTHPIIISIMAQQKRNLDILEIMQESRILLVNLERYKPLRPDLIYLLGTLLTNDIISEAFSREEHERKPCYLFLDECHHFTTRDLIPILVEGRAFKLHLILAHQFLKQLSDKDELVFEAIFNDARTKIVFGGLPNHDLRLLSEELYTNELNTYQIKDEIKSPVFEPVEETRESISIGKNQSETEGNSSTIQGSISPSFNFAQIKGTSKTRSKAHTSGKVDSYGSVDSSGLGSGSGSGWGEVSSYSGDGLFPASSSLSSSGFSSSSDFSGHADSEGHGDVESDTLGKALTKSKATGKGFGLGMSLGGSFGKNFSKTKGTSFSITKQPFHAYKKYEIITSRTFQDIPEQIFEKIQALKGQPKRCFSLKFPEKKVLELKTPFVEPTGKQRLLDQLTLKKEKERIFLETNLYSTPEEAIKERQRLLNTWKESYQLLLLESSNNKEDKINFKSKQPKPKGNKHGKQKT